VPRPRRYPAAKETYDARSALFNTEGLSCPVLLLQGDEDKIVPPNQAETMHAALKAKGIPTALKMYEGEQHGFRQAKNIQDALNSELYFFSRVFGFDAPGVAPFAIDNLAETAA
jgi:dipeptidyl aminopeptidase/acylaminoacyl peptidase